MSKKVFVSGCFDLLHSGHIAFFKAAAEYGDLYVAIGADQTVFELKGRPTINTQEERLFMIQSVGCVKSAVVSSGSGMLDFAPALCRIQPDLFVVNEDGDVPEKQKLCREPGIEYIDRYEAQLLGEYLSALANTSCLTSQPCGYLVFGIDDKTHEVVGTSFDPYTVKAKGNQDLLLWLAAGLHPNTGFEVHIVGHPDGRVVPDQCRRLLAR